MKARIVALVLVVGVAAIACTPNQEDEGLRDARQVCIDFGLGDDESEDSSDDSGDTMSTEELADGLDELANQAARAARLDRRWDRLSNTVTDMQEWAEKMAITEDEAQPQSDRDTAQQEADRLDSSRLLQVVRQECRKALAE